MRPRRRQALTKKFLRGCGRFLLAEALAAEDRATLGRAKRHGGIFAALGADRPGLDALVSGAVARHRRRGGQYGNALGFARFAALGLVLEMLVVKKELLSGCEHEGGPTVDAGQYLILKFH